MASLIRSVAAALIFGISGAASATSPSAGAAFALLADNRLLAVDLDTRGVLAEKSLGSAPKQLTETGRRLALSKDRALVYALVVTARRSSVVVLDARNGQVRNRYLLPLKVAFQAMVVGPRTGRIYAFGNRTTGRAQAMGKPIVSIVGRAGKVVRTLAFRTTAGHWHVYDGAVSPDERTLFASYHGVWNGVDWLRLGTKVTRCGRSHGLVGCVRAHGAIEPLGGDLLIATGTPAVWEVDLRGRVLERFDTRLTGNHLMEFAVDAERQEFDAIGSCGYTGGLSRVSLEGGTALRLGFPAPPASSEEALRPGICGERIALGDWPLAVVAKTHRPVPRKDADGQLVFVDRADGVVTRTVATPSEPIDVIVSP